MELISIGIIQKPHGIRGEVKVFPKTDFITERFKKGNAVILELNGKKTPYTIDTVRMHKGSVLVKFKEVNSLNDVEFFHKGELFIEREAQHELPEDEFYFVDLVGCVAYDNDQELGLVTEVIETPAHPVLRIKSRERDILVPFVERFIASVDIKAKKIMLNWMEGL